MGAAGHEDGSGGNGDGEQEFQSPRRGMGAAGQASTSTTAPLATWRFNPLDGEWARPGHKIVKPRLAGLSEFQSPRRGMGAAGRRTGLGMMLPWLLQ